MQTSPYTPPKLNTSCSEKTKSPASETMFNVVEGRDV